MSHFTVWVIGPDPEEQLAPFDENSEVEPYKDYLTGANLQRMQEHYKTTDLAQLVNFMEDWTSAKGGLDEEGLYSWSTYNPQSKWDWYQLGGRWLGSLILKQHATTSGVVGRPGTFHNRPAHEGGVDQALKGEIDFEAMEREARVAATTYFIQLEQAVAGLPAPMTWKECLKAEPNVEVARQAYGNQLAVKAIAAARLDDFQSDAVEDLRLGREAYVTRATQHSWVPRAVVHESRWNEVGQMGWWGMSSDVPQDWDPWAAEVRSVILNLPDDTLISVMDCHI